MSIDIDWSLLSSPSPSSLSSSLIDALNSGLNSSSRPSFLGPITVTSFDFGTVGPDVEIRDIRDVWRAFDEGDKDDEDGDEDGDGDGEDRGGGLQDDGVAGGLEEDENRFERSGRWRGGVSAGAGGERRAVSGPAANGASRSGRAGASSRSHYSDGFSNNYFVGGGDPRAGPSSSASSIRRSQSQHSMPAPRQASRRRYAPAPAAVDEAPEDEEGYEFIERPGADGMRDPASLDEHGGVGEGRCGGGADMAGFGEGGEEESVFSGLASPRPSAAAVGLGVGGLALALGRSRVGVGMGIGGVGLGGLVRPSSSRSLSIPRSYSLPPSYSPLPPRDTPARVTHVTHAPPPHLDADLKASRRHSYRSHTQTHTHTHNRPLSPISSPPLSPPARPRGLGLPPATDNPIPSVQLHVHVSHSPNLVITLLTSLQVNYPSSLFMTLPLKLSITGLTVCADFVIAYSGSRNRMHLTIVDDEQVVTPGGGGGGGGGGAGTSGTGAGSRSVSASSTGPSPGGNTFGGTGQTLPIGQRLLPNLHIESEIGHADAHVLRNVGKVERFIADVVRKTIVDELVFPNFYTIAL